MSELQIAIIFRDNFPNFSIKTNFYSSLKAAHVQKILMRCHNIPYILGYKTFFFSFQNNPKDLDPSYKMDLDL